MVPLKVYVVVGGYEVGGLGWDFIDNGRYQKCLAIGASNGGA